MVLNIVGRHADAATFEQLHALAKAATDDAAHRRLYLALAAARDPKLAEQVAGIALSSELPPQDIQLRLAMIGTLRRDHPQLGWSTFSDHAEMLLSPFGNLAPLFEAQYVPQLFWNSLPPDKMRGLDPRARARRDERLHRERHGGRALALLAEAGAGAGRGCLPDGPRLAHVADRGSCGDLGCAARSFVLTLCDGALRSPLPPRHELEVEAQDIDAYDHVNNAVYLTWLTRRVVALGGARRAGSRNAYACGGESRRSAHRDRLRAPPTLRRDRVRVATWTRRLRPLASSGVSSCCGPTTARRWRARAPIRVHRP